ncbi:MAG: hypothetical protein UZ04_CHB001001601 [Chlorobi bacterium OLB4]|nr:MAG: hypothetical protein UZ04_CHB001001601 [Chlorobi bacterium OLB4]MBV6399659.1 hypothetical protein [Ignavibacteria bacterium]
MQYLNRHDALLIFVISLLLLSSLVHASLYNTSFTLLLGVFAGIFIISFFLITRAINDVVINLSFLIVILSFFNFTIAPYSKYTEESYNYIFAPILFLTILFHITGNEYKNSLIKFNTFDKFLILTSFLFLTLSTFVFNPREISEFEGILKYINFSVGIYIFSVVLAGFLYKNENILFNFMRIICLIGILAAIFGIMTVIYPDLKPDNEYPGTAISFFKHPNATSSMYNFSIPLLVWMIIWKKKELSLLEHKFYIIGFFVSLIALLFTFSRFGIATIFLSILIIFYGYSRKLFVFSVIFTILAVAFAITQFFTTKGAITILGRLGLLETSFVMMSDNIKLLFGYGGSRTREIFEGVKFSLGVIDLNNNPHNIILFSILMYGLLFTITSTILIFKYYYKALMLVLKKNADNLTVLSFSLCTGIFVKNMGEDLLLFPEFFMWYLFLIFFGILLIKIMTLDYMQTDTISK